jgi:hypothetical protein
VLSQSGTINVGAEMNPDTEATDIGYSVHDTFHTFFTDWTNMHYYRWIVSVNGSSAIMTVERLY